MKLIEANAIFLASMKGVKSASNVKWHRQRLNSLSNFLGEETAIEGITVHQLRKWRGTYQIDQLNTLGIQRAQKKLVDCRASPYMDMSGLFGVFLPGLLKKVS